MCCYSTGSAATATATDFITYSWRQHDRNACGPAKISPKKPFSQFVFVLPERIQQAIIRPEMKNQTSLNTSTAQRVAAMTLRTVSLRTNLRSECPCSPLLEFSCGVVVVFGGP